MQEPQKVNPLLWILGTTITIAYGVFMFVDHSLIWSGRPPPLFSLLFFL